MTAPYLSVPVFSWPAAPGGLLYTYAPGGVSAKTTYQADGTTPNSNPVVLDTTGTAVVRGDGLYHFLLKDSTGATTLWDADYYQVITPTAAGIGAVLYPQTDAEIAAAITPTDYSYEPYDVRRYGVLPDCTGFTATFGATLIGTDNTTALNALGAAAWPSPITLFFPDGDYLITDTVTFTCTRISLDMDSQARFMYNGTADRSAVILTSPLVSNAKMRVLVANNTSHSWTNMSFIGVQITGSWIGCDISLPYVLGFTINHQLNGSSVLGIAYNTFSFGKSYSARYHLNLHSSASLAFINENLFITPDAQTITSYDVTQESYGLVVDAAVGAYTGQNQNIFIKPSWQLTQGGTSAVRVPCWFNNAGAYCKVISARAEGVNGPLVKISSDTVAVTNLDIEFGYASTNIGSISAALSETDGGLSSNNLVYYKNATQTRTLQWHSGDLVQKAFSVSAGNIAVKGFFMQGTGSGSETYSGAGKVGKDYVILTTAASGNLGFYVDTSLIKNFELRADCQSNRTGRPTFVAYDSTGTIISTTRAITFGGISENSNFGGHSYTVGSDWSGTIPFKVDSTVKKIKILLGTGTANCHVRSIQLIGYVSEVTAAASAYQMAVWGGPVVSDQILASTIPSTALGSGYSNLGMTVNNTASSTVWRCTAAGWNALAWTINTVVLLNELRSNGGNTYVCTTAGTTAGAGGPTTTATGIVDNTAVWDYVGFPVTTTATWT